MGRVEEYLLRILSKMLTRRRHLRKDMKERKNELDGCLKDDVLAEQTKMQMSDMRKCFKCLSNEEKKMRLQQSKN